MQIINYKEKYKNEKKSKKKYKTLFKEERQKRQNENDYNKAIITGLKNKMNNYFNYEQDETIGVMLEIESIDKIINLLNNERTILINKHDNMNKKKNIIVDLLEPNEEEEQNEEEQNIIFIDQDDLSQQAIDGIDDYKSMYDNKNMFCSIAHETRTQKRRRHRKAKRERERAEYNKKKEDDDMIYHEIIDVEYINPCDNENLYNMSLDDTNNIQQFFHRKREAKQREG